MGLCRVGPCSTRRGCWTCCRSCTAMALTQLPTGSSSCWMRIPMWGSAQPIQVQRGRGHPWSGEWWSRKSQCLNPSHKLDRLFENDTNILGYGSVIQKQYSYLDDFLILVDLLMIQTKLNQEKSRYVDGSLGTRRGTPWCVDNSKLMCYRRGNSQEISSLTTQSNQWRKQSRTKRGKSEEPHMKFWTLWKTSMPRVLLL